MANTTNLDLVKPAGTDHALISVLNSNSDKIDAFAGQTNDSLSAEQNGLAYIVGNTNTTGGTLAVGQFVYVKGHSTIAEGLRKVTASISANASITTSNTDACSEGGLNALNSNIMSINSAELLTGDNLTDLETALNNKLSSMSNGDKAFVEFRFNGTFSPFMNTRYAGDLYRPYSQYAWALLYGSNANAILCKRGYSGWTYKDISA